MFIQPMRDAATRKMVAVLSVAIIFKNQMNMVIVFTVDIILILTVRDVSLTTVHTKIVEKCTKL